MVPRFSPRSAASAVLAAALAVTCSLPLAASDPPQDNPEVRGDRLEWSAVATTSGTLTLTGPEGYTAVLPFAAGEVPSLAASRNGAPLADGEYRWRLERRPAGAAVRSRGDHAPAPASSVTTGAFRIVGGTFALPAGADPESAGRDILYIDDVIVDSNLCVGTGCINNENFGNDSLRLKDVNNRIHFWDTSSTAFPTRDWRITVNDSAPGTATYFAIDDVDAGTTPFRIDGSAPAAAVHVGSSGSVGLGTTTPQTKLHLVTGNTPTLRLEQDGSGSFLPAVWDLAANEGGMFIREQDGSAFGVLPFRIRNGAPASSLYVAGSGSVGVGTAAPAGPLHVFRNAGTDPLEMLILENNGKPRLVLDNSTDAGGRWFFGLNNSSEFVISLQGSPANELRLDQAGNGTFRGALNATAFNPVSDVHAKHRIEAVEPDKVLEALANLPIATWAFRGEAVRHIGPMAQDFHAAFGFGDDPRRISTHDTDGVALAAIQGLHSIVKTKDAEIQALEARLAALEALVTALSEGG